MVEKIKRDTMPLYPPWFYEIMPGECPYCGSKDLTWSEYKHYIACNNCKKDIKPTCDGILDGGPIPEYASSLFGIRFDILDLKTNKIKYYGSLPQSRQWKDTKKFSNSAFASSIIEKRFTLIDEIYKIALEKNLIDFDDEIHRERKRYIKRLFNGQERVKF